MSRAVKGKLILSGVASHVRSVGLKDIPDSRADTMLEGINSIN